jgi:hypothetical protein
MPEEGRQSPFDLSAERQFKHDNDFEHPRRRFVSGIA